jgi:hypothetical protein
MTTLEIWELASYVVTCFGFPYAIIILMYENHKERENDDEEIYQKLAEEYAKFGNLLIENADLQLMTNPLPEEKLSAEQKERKTIIFEMLVSLLERAFILVYEDHMDAKTKRLWATWEDYIRFWCHREDFRKALPALLVGEDPEFTSYMRGIANEPAV